VGNKGQQMSKLEKMTLDPHMSSLQKAFAKSQNKADNQTSFQSE
jgi:hypothetical protein